MSGPSAYMNVVYSVLESGLYVFAGSDSGLARSSDRGLHWTHITNGLAHGDTSLKVESMIAGTNGRLYLTLASWFNIPFGLYTSSDQGTSWHKLTSPILDRYFSIARDSSGNLYVGTESNGAFISRDDGKNWKSIPGANQTSGVPAIEVSPAGNVYAVIQKMLYRKSPADTGWQPFSTYPNWVYCVAFDDKSRLLIGQDSNIYRCSEGGGTWDTLHRFPYYDYASRLIAAGHSILAEEGGWLLISRDTGMTWTYCDTIMPYRAAHGVTLGPSGTIYVGGEEGEVFRTSDTCRTWIDINNSLPRSPMSSLGFTRSGSILAGGMGQNTGRTQFFRTTNRGLTWSGIGYPSNAAYPKMCVSPDGIVIVPRYDSGYVLSFDSGTTWRHGYFPVRSERPLSFSFGRNTLLLGAGDSDVYVSLDTGTTWSNVMRYSPYSPVEATAVGLDGSLWVSRKDSGMYHSTDLGAHWTHYDHHVIPAASKIVIDSTGTVYMLSDMWHYAVWRLEPSDTWKKVYDVQGNYSDICVSRIALYVFDGAVMRSTNHGTSWTQYIANQAPTVQVQSIMADDKGYLWAAGEGIFQSDRQESSGVLSANVAVDELQCFPNPAGRVLHLRLSENAGSVYIMDLQGNIVREYDTSALINREAALDVSTLSSGAYIIRSSVANGIQMRRFEVIH